MKLARSILLKLGLAPTLLGMVTACSPAPMPTSQSSRDPSSPTAPEGVTPPVAASATPPATGAHEGHDHASTSSPADAGSQATVYVCPMHPEVTSSTPGVCPKCNMKLVPKK
jgi:hypothetical protein